MILLIDNYDSFVFNLARYLHRLGQRTLVKRNDELAPAEIERLAPSAIVLSPGPCSPTEAGYSLDLVREFCGRLPILGVCLGHQTIAAALGGHIVRSKEPMHGRASLVEHNGRDIFAGAPNPLTACRYHSLVVEEASLPPELEVTARTADGTVMAIAHRTAPVVGVQFHPESILTDRGYLLLANFLRLAEINVQGEPPPFESELAVSQTRPYQAPATPVTF